MVVVTGYGQTIYHPKSSESIVSVSSGRTYHYYDSGGPTANHSGKMNSLITIYPKTKGEYVSINCANLDIGATSRMYIFDGNHAGSPILGYFNGRGGIEGMTYTASEENKSGAISIRFTSINAYMSNPGWDFTVTTSKSPGRGRAVTPQDCSGAIKVCSDSAITTRASGKGIQELPGPGFWNRTLNYGGDGENQSNWYKFEVKTAGRIEFLITPNTHTDFDWALWGPYKAHECPAWTTDNYYRASACDAQYNEGLTGLSSSAMDYVESSGGDCYVAALDVRAGEHYVIMIDDWSGKNTTFKLTWTFKNGAALECKEDEEPPEDPTEAMDTSLIDDVPAALEVVTQLNPDYLAAGGDPAAVGVPDINSPDAPKMEAELSEDEKMITIKYPGAFDWQIENSSGEVVEKGRGLKSKEIDISNLPAGEYKAAIYFKQVQHYASFVKK